MLWKVVSDELCKKQSTMDGKKHIAIGKEEGRSECHSCVEFARVERVGAER